jgi:hypothetical protein
VQTSTLAGNAHYIFEKDGKPESGKPEERKQMKLTIEERLTNLENAVASLAFAKEFGPGQPETSETVKAFHQGLGVEPHEEPTSRLTPDMTDEEWHAAIRLRATTEQRPAAKEFKYKYGSAERWANIT